MQLTCLGSSSSGNGYLIHNRSECLIIEAGIHLDRVKEALDFKLHYVVGCISSHSHGDHSKWITKYANSGISIYAHESVFEKRTSHHNFHVIKESKVFKVGNFRIMPLPLSHDVPCFGFYINHPETGNFCFLTDTSDVPYQFKELNHILIECNFDDDIIDTNETHYSLRDRVKTNHLSLERCAEFLRNNDLSNVHSITLLHASDFNSDVAAFRAEIMKRYNKTVYIADKGLKIDFNYTPF